MKKIAVTGANGYIGTFLCEFFRQYGYDVFEMKRKLSAACSDHFISYALNKEVATEKLKNIDVLIHCAYDFSSPDYEKSRAINVKGSEELFKKAKQAGIKKIIYLSSVSSFAQAVSNYGKIKYEIEQVAKSLGVIIIRPGLVFSRDAGGIVGAMSKLTAKLPVIPIIGKGDQLFYPCHVEDLALLINAVINSQESFGEPIVAAAETRITFKEILLSMANSHGRKVTLLPIPYVFHYAGLRLAELLNIPLGLRSDSLKYMKYSNKNMDFSLTRKLKINFRSFSL